MNIKKSGRGCKVIKKIDMDVIEIPYMSHNLIIFYGEPARKAFNGKVRVKDKEWEDDPDADGLQFENNIFIEDKNDKEVIIHEAYHFLDWLFLEMGITDEPEFKSYVSSHVYMALLFGGLNENK